MKKPSAEAPAVVMNQKQYREFTDSIMSHKTDEINDYSTSKKH